MEKPLESEAKEVVKVIAIKLPFDLEERILTFPFLHAIREHYPEADLHFITPKKEIEVLNLLPFTAYYHEFDEDEIENVFDVHRYCASAKIYNVDVFISLTNSFVDACLGLGLRAKKRVGFSDNWKTLVLTHKIPRPVGHHVVEDYYALYETLVDAKVNTRLKVMSRDLTAIVPDADEQPYIAVNLSPLRGPTIEDEWIELLSSFENQKILVFATDEVVKFQGLVEPFLAALPQKNLYINFSYKNWIELARMLAHARGLISYAGPAGGIAAYVGTKSVLLYESQDPQKTGPFYFLADVAVMGVNNPNVVNANNSSGSIKNRTTFNMSEVFIKAMEFFRL